MTKLAIILVNYNEEKLTKKCLNSLLSADFQDYQRNIIVVDNGSSKVLKLGKNYLDNQVFLLRSESNLGFTGGNNLGISFAIKELNTELFLLINNDTYVKSDFFVQLSQTLNNDSHNGIVVPKIYFAHNREFHHNSYNRSQKGKVIWYAGGIIDWKNILTFHKGVNEIDRGQFDQTEETDFATGCCMLIKREVIESVGILDKKYFLYYEDVDFSLRAKNKKFKVIYEPKAVIWHFNAGSSNNPGSFLQNYYIARNRLLFALRFIKYTGWLGVLRVIVNMILSKDPYQLSALVDMLFGRLGKQQKF